MIDAIAVTGDAGDINCWSGIPHHFAQAARAHYLVTGNAKDFPAKWADTQIVTARQFLDAVV